MIMTTKTKKNTNTENPVWFITGCSTGFGRELATQALERGYRVVVTARKPDEVEALAAKGEALVLKLDVTDQSQIDTAIKAAEKQFGGIDVLVNNAGIGYGSSAEFVGELTGHPSISGRFRGPSRAWASAGLVCDGSGSAKPPAAWRPERG
jgi:NAD(P)-dependent dehydrogenase (short-subunit alcohol dehydrogenase family)